MKTVKGCRHKPRCKAGTAGAMVRHHPSKELPKDVYEFGRKALKKAAEIRATSASKGCTARKVLTFVNDPGDDIKVGCTRRSGHKGKHRPRMPWWLKGPNVKRLQKRRKASH